jgi:hypothetical protein
MYESKSKMIKKGTVAQTSEVGHYNFVYPLEDKQCTFLSDAIISCPPWPKQQDLIAVSVMGESLHGAEYKGNKKYIVWVKESDIERY